MRSRILCNLAAEYADIPTDAGGSGQVNIAADDSDISAD